MTEESAAYLEMMTANQFTSSRYRLFHIVTGRIRSITRHLNKALQEGFAKQNPNLMRFK